MKTLIVAHPDDEILWFNPFVFDLIIIVFCDRDDKKGMGDARKQAVNKLPYSKKILMLNLTEPGTWKNSDRVIEYKTAEIALINQLNEIKNVYPISSIFTHNHEGEYGHLDHILVHQCVKKTFLNHCQIWAPNIFIKNENTKKYFGSEYTEKNSLLKFFLLRNVYVRCGAWTWNLRYFPRLKQSYHLVNGDVFMNDKTIASLASIPQRVCMLEKTIASIIDQFDIIKVYLNGYDKIPSFLSHDKIQIFSSDAHENRGDVGKFFPLQNCLGYLFTLDDDLLYPADYAKMMISKIRQYNHSAFICVHANTLPKNLKLDSYYKDKKVTHFSKKLKQDKNVNIPGTGTLAFHSSLYEVKMEDFPLPNMCDIWLYKIAKGRNIPVVSIERKRRWLTSLIYENDHNTIYEKTRCHDEQITKIINQIAGTVAIGDDAVID